MTASPPAMGKEVNNDEKTAESGQFVVARVLVRFPRFVIFRMEVL